MVSLKPIVPKGPIVDRNIGKKIEGELLNWGARVLSRLANYPPQMPTKYQRTGTLGRQWKLRAGTESGVLFVEVYNAASRTVHGRTRGYAGYVQGPKSGEKGERQTAVMRAKGWLSVSDVGPGEWRSTSSRISGFLRHPQ